MGTREKLYSLLEVMTEEQLSSLFQFLSSFLTLSDGAQMETGSTDKLDSLMGIFHDAADPAKRALEKTAWESAAVEKHLSFLEEQKNENA